MIHSRKCSGSWENNQNKVNTQLWDTLYVVGPFLVFNSLIRPSKCPHSHLHRFSIPEQFQNVATQVISKFVFWHLVIWILVQFQKCLSVLNVICNVQIMDKINSCKWCNTLLLASYWINLIFSCLAFHLSIMHTYFYISWYQPG